MIEIKKRPYSYNWSGNPAFYELNSLAAAADAEMYFEVEIYFKHVNELTFNLLTTLELYPAGGTAKLNIADILNSELDYDVPEFHGNEKLVYECSSQSGLFYIRYREIDPDGIVDPPWNTDSGNTLIIVKGGIDYMSFRGDNYWTNYFEVNKPFLTWQRSGRMAGPTERMYLAWLNHIGQATAANIKVRIIVTWTDGTTTQAADQVMSSEVLLVANAIYFIPCGAAQWGLQALNPAKKIYKWMVQVQDLTDDPVALSEVFTFYHDNNSDYNDVTLHYRNSLGGLDSVRVRGVIEEKLNFDYKEEEKYVEADYYSGKTVSGRRVISNSKETVLYSGDVGHLPKKDQDRLRDMHLQREVWREVRKKWLPVNLVTGNFTQRSSDSNLFSMPVEWTMAHNGDNFYTPAQIDLGDNEFSDNISNAFIENLVLQQTDQGADYDLEIDFAINDPDSEGVTEFEYQIKRKHATVQSGVVGDLPITVTGLTKDEAYVLTIQPVNPSGIRGVMKCAWFFNGKFGVGANNSSVINLTGLDAQIDVERNTVAQLTDEVVDHCDMHDFNQGTGTGLTIVVTNDSFAFDTVKLVTDSSEYLATISPSNVATFTGVDVSANGYAIVIE